MHISDTKSEIDRVYWQFFEKSVPTQDLQQKTIEIKLDHSLDENLQSLEKYERRLPFHDSEIQSIQALNKRVVIRMTELTLVVTGASELKRCKAPTAWLNEKTTRTGDRFLLEVETESGDIRVIGTNLRLIRNADLSILIPPIDPR
jgi:hypothetical protein